MLPRAVLRTAARPMSSMASQTPVEDVMRTKIKTALEPSTLEIYNDSQAHAHHQAMRGTTSAETHFRVVITSEAFRSKMQPARHRMVYALLKDEMAQAGGIHALQLRTLTPEEAARQSARAEEQQSESVAEGEHG
ncbi:MAG: hypothetical protein M1833_003824 [Piccolia ochrophora]|nr:MAG: hypothetical protein M1833_003824 [Piccolia ochrophora]